MDELTPEATEAIHKAKSAQQAIEVAREAQLAEIVRQTAEATTNAVSQSLERIFGDSDNKDPDQMRILVRRIPILCTNVAQMHDDIGVIKDNQQWAIRLIIGGIVSILGSIATGVIILLVTKYLQ